MTNLINLLIRNTCFLEIFVMKYPLQKITDYLNIHNNLFQKVRDSNSTFSTQNTFPNLKTYYYFFCFLFGVFSCDLLKANIFPDLEYVDIYSYERGFAKFKKILSLRQLSLILYGVVWM